MCAPLTPPSSPLPHPSASAAPAGADAAGVGGLAAAVNLGAAAADVRAGVSEYYGATLKETADLKTSACCTAVAPPPRVREILRSVPDEVCSKYYGCGSPFPAGLAGSAARVLDLGCGSGRDCFVAAALVGARGAVLGLDMTPAQLDVGRRHAEAYCRDTLGYAAANLRFAAGAIEDLAAAGVADASVDLVISNCVVNLSADKAAVLREAYRVLAPGGEMYFSDVYADRRLPAAVRAHPVLLGECLGGALYAEDFLRLARAAGFADPRRAAPPTPFAVTDPELAVLVGGARFFSITYRLFKLPGRLESLCEDYGQAVRYKGTVTESPVAFTFDDHHVFEAGKLYEACGNTAAMLGESWLAPHFEVIGDRSAHYGAFKCGAAPAVAAAPAPAAPALAGGGCC